MARRNFNLLIISADAFGINYVHRIEQPSSLSICFPQVSITPNSLIIEQHFSFPPDSLQSTLYFVSMNLPSADI